MAQPLFCKVLMFLCLLHYGFCDTRLCGDNSFIKTRSCSTQILGHEHSVKSCQVKSLPSNSAECKDMKFGPIESNTYIGGVSLKPYKMTHSSLTDSFNMKEHLTVLNITFTNIKWKTMKFRFQRIKNGTLVNHCTNIVISNNVTLNDQSVLYYDCYWSETDYIGQSYNLDFEATNDKIVNRGQYNFNIPSPNMFDPNVSINDWIPFTYIEILPSTMLLHILPPPSHLKVKAYNIMVKKEFGRGTQCNTNDFIKNSTVTIRNSTDEVTYGYRFPVDQGGSFYFVVIPIHDDCNLNMTCQRVESPRIIIINETPSRNICIVSVAALFVSILFAYYLVLRFLRRRCMPVINEMDYMLKYNEPKILVIYSNANKLFSNCVSSLVVYLRAQGFDVMYDGDIVKSTQSDPFAWAEKVFTECTHVMYIVSPSDDCIKYNMYNQPIANQPKDVDAVQLSFLKANQSTNNPKKVFNVLFDFSHSTIPVITKHEKKFHLLRDWAKMLAFLSINNTFFTKQQLMRTEEGKQFLGELNRAQKVFSGSKDVVVPC